MERDDYMVGSGCYHTCMSAMYKREREILEQGGEGRERERESVSVCVSAYHCMCMCACVCP